MILVAAKFRLRADGVRDLIGLVRVLYRAAPSEDLRAAGEGLQAALTLADSPLGSLGHKASLRRFVSAVEQLEGLRLSALELDAAVRAAVVSVEPEHGERRDGKAHRRRRG